MATQLEKGLVYHSMMERSRHSQRKWAHKHTRGSGERLGRGKAVGGGGLVHAETAGDCCMLVPMGYASRRGERRFVYPTDAGAVKALTE